jgi:hypothetical protein
LLACRWRHLIELWHDVRVFCVCCASVFVLSDTLGARLGQPGQFGYAVHAVSKLDPKIVRAVKVISKARFTRHADVKYHFDQLRSEIKVMQKVRHITTTFANAQAAWAGPGGSGARRSAPAGCTCGANQAMEAAGLNGR